MTILTLDQFEEFAEAYPELAECVCLDEVEVPLNVEDN
jgi:hypothetical protein